MAQDTSVDKSQASFGLEEKVERAARQGVAKVKHGIEKVEKPLTVLFEHLEEWLRDNHFIISGYRPQSNSYLKSAQSLGYMHNESVNIWSHLLGAIGFVLFGIKLWNTAEPLYAMADRQDILAFCCFFAGAIACLGMSATFHTISNHSLPVATFGNKLDYLGIVALITASFVPMVYYGFSCDPQIVRVYSAMIVTIGAGCAIVSSADKFRTAEWRLFRTLMFVGMGLSSVLPVLHAIQLYGVERLQSLMSLKYVVSQGLLYLVGAALYAARIPERFAPGRFDIYGASHQIFHFLVVAAAATHLVGLIKAFQFRHSSAFPAICQR